MNNKLSDLMDGELDANEANELIKIIGKNGELLTQWKIYHVIGEALRQPASVSSLDVSEKVRQQLVSEPALLAPQFNKICRAGKSKLLGLSAAASIAVLVVGWIASVSIDNSPVLQQQMLVAEKMEKQPIGTDNHPVTFLPPSGYSHLPAPIDYNHAGFPFVYKGVTHGGIIYNPHGNHFNQINKPLIPQTSIKPASGN